MKKLLLIFALVGGASVFVAHAEEDDPKCPPLAIGTPGYSGICEITVIMGIKNAFCNSLGGIGPGDCMSTIMPE